MANIARIDTNSVVINNLAKTAGVLAYDGREHSRRVNVREIPEYLDESAAARSMRLMGW